MKFLLVPENENQMDGWLKIYEPVVNAVSVWKPHNWLNGINHRTVDEDNKGSCGRPFNGPLQVQWNGKIVSCCYDYNSEIVLGNCNTETPEEVFTGAVMRSFEMRTETGAILNMPSAMVASN